MPGTGRDREKRRSSLERRRRFPSAARYATLFPPKVATRSSLSLSVSSCLCSQAFRISGSACQQRATEPSRESRVASHSIRDLGISRGTRCRFDRPDVASTFDRVALHRPLEVTDEDLPTTESQPRASLPSPTSNRETLARSAVASRYGNETRPRYGKVVSFLGDESRDSRPARRRPLPSGRYRELACLRPSSLAPLAPLARFPPLVAFVQRLAFTPSLVPNDATAEGERFFSHSRLERRITAFARLRTCFVEAHVAVAETRATIERISRFPLERSERFRARTLRVHRNQSPRRSSNTNSRDFHRSLIAIREYDRRVSRALRNETGTFLE